MNKWTRKNSVGILHTWNTVISANGRQIEVIAILNFTILAWRSTLQKELNNKYFELTFFVVIEELGGTTQTDHLDSRTSKTHVSGWPEVTFCVSYCLWLWLTNYQIFKGKIHNIGRWNQTANLPWYVNDVKECNSRFFLLPPPVIYHLVPQSAPQQPARGDGWWPWVLTLDHTI